MLRPARVFKKLKWAAIVVALIASVLLCNMLMTSRLYGFKKTQAKKTKTSPEYELRPPTFLAGKDKLQSSIFGEKSLLLPNTTVRLLLKPGKIRHGKVSNQKLDFTGGKDRKTAVPYVVTIQPTGVLTNETLKTAVGSDILNPGSEAEAVARKLMGVRRYEIINPHNFGYRINPSQVCLNKSVEVVLCVVSAVENFQARQQFRYSIKGGYAGIWNEVSKAVLVFFLGIPRPSNASNLQQKIEQESRLYGDIVQSTYIDSYKNLSIKTVSILKWISTHCANARFVVKTDDDCDVNIPLMMTELKKKQADEPLFMLGKLSRKLTPLRNRKSKWYIPYTMYKGEKYPAFLYGGSQGYPAAVARLLYETSLRIPTFWLEDVYVSGLCASFLNIPRYDKVAFYFSHFPPPEEKEY